MEAEAVRASAFGLLAKTAKFPYGRVYSVTWQFNAPSGCPRGKWGQGGGTRSKDSNAAVGVRDRSTQKAPEGYDRQTNFPRVIVRFYFS